MDYNSHNGQNLHRHHHSRNQSFSSAMLDAICKSTEVEGRMMAYKNSSNRQDMRKAEAMKNTVMRNSIIERQWEEDEWKKNEKLMHGRASKVGIFNADQKTEAEAAYIKHRESRRFFQSSMSSAAFCSSDYASNTSSISCPYLCSDAESLYRHNYIRTVKTERNSHHVGCGDRTCKCVVGRECSRDLHRKSSVRDGCFRSTEKPFNPADPRAKIKSKSETGNYSKKPSQPISPGRKLINFVNSLFMPEGSKKPKFSSSSFVSDSNSCSSSEKKPATVYSSSSLVQSRSRLSKTSTGSNNTSGMSQKSLTFHPTSVNVDKADSRPCGKKCLHRVENPSPNPIFWYYAHTHPSKGAYKLPLLEKQNHEAAVVAKSIIGKYRTANGIMEAVVRTLDKQEEEEDVASCSSSDLFELENLTDIDMNTYQKELSVYKTTHWETNKVIGNRLIV